MTTSTPVVVEIGGVRFWKGQRWDRREKRCGVPVVTILAWDKERQRIQTRGMSDAWSCLAGFLRRHTISVDKLNPKPHNEPRLSNQPVSR